MKVQAEINQVRNRNISDRQINPKAGSLQFCAENAKVFFSVN